MTGEPRGEAEQVGYELGLAGKGWTALKLVAWIFWHAGRFTEDELRVKLNTARAKIGREPV